MNTLYKYFDIWKRIDRKTVARYRCFEIVGKNQFVVQNKDFYRNDTTEITRFFLEKNYVELLIEKSPESRSPCCSTIEQAIFEFEKRMSDDKENGE